MLIDPELIAVFGVATAGDELPVLAQQATEQLTIRKVWLVACEHGVDTKETRMRERREQLRRRG